MRNQLGTHFAQPSDRWSDQPTLDQRIRLRERWITEWRVGFGPPVARWQIWWTDPLHVPIEVDRGGPDDFDGWCWTKTWRRGSGFSGLSPRAAIILSGTDLHSEGQCWMVPIAGKRLNFPSSVPVVCTFQHGPNGIPAEKDAEARVMWLLSGDCTQSQKTTALLKYGEERDDLPQPALTRIARDLLANKFACRDCPPPGAVVEGMLDKFTGIVLASHCWTPHWGSRAHNDVLYVAQKIVVRGSYTEAEAVARGIIVLKAGLQQDLFHLGTLTQVLSNDVQVTVAPTPDIPSTIEHLVNGLLGDNT